MFRLCEHHVTLELTVEFVFSLDSWIAVTESKEEEGEPEEQGQREGGGREFDSQS